MSVKPPGRGSTQRRGIGWPSGWFGARRKNDERSASAAGDGAGEALAVQIREELRSRLLVHDPQTQAVGHLSIVYGHLRKGWAGVDELPRHVVNLARVEAQLLQAQEPTPLLSLFIDRLDSHLAAADARARHDAMAQEEERWERTDVPDVSEATHEEFEQMERSWLGTVPAALDALPESDPHPQVDSRL